MRVFNAECLTEFLNSSIKGHSCKGSGIFNEQILTVGIYTLDFHYNPFAGVGLFILVPLHFQLPFKSSTFIEGSMRNMDFVISIPRSSREYCSGYQFLL